MTTTNRFKAGVVADGMSGGLLRDSAIHRLDRVATPLLLIHGQDDSVVGLEQAGEIFVGLSVLGKEVTLLAYRGESHVPSRFREAHGLT